MSILNLSNIVYEFSYPTAAADSGSILDTPPLLTFDYGFFLKGQSNYANEVSLRIPLSNPYPTAAAISAQTSSFRL